MTRQQRPLTVKGQDRRRSPVGWANEQTSILRSWYPRAMSATMVEDDRDGMARLEEDGTETPNIFLVLLVGGRGFDSVEGLGREANGDADFVLLDFDF